MKVKICLCMAIMLNTIAIPIIHSATVMCDIRLGSNYMYSTILPCKSWLLWVSNSLMMCILVCRRWYGDLGCWCVGGGMGLQHQSTELTPQKTTQLCWGCWYTCYLSLGYFFIRAIHFQCANYDLTVFKDIGKV